MSNLFSDWADRLGPAALLATALVTAASYFAI
jgi:hypothetical protein